jgi:hypothetical protein
VYVTGGFKDVTDFDPGPPVFFLTPIGSIFGMNDVFVLKLDNITILPVELLSFEAHNSNAEVVCNWSTATELNNDFFTVMRSHDGNEFKALGTVTGAGNSIVKNDYTFKDENPLPGISYYYLMQTDFDGRTSSSAVVSVKRNETGTIYISPNPAKDVIYIYLDNQNNLPVSISIMNLFGQVVESKTLEMNHTLLIDISHLANGSYFITLEQGNSRTVRKIIKAKK